MSNSTDETLIPPMAKRGRNNVSEEEDEEENKDILSDLPDCILLHILSFLKAKYAVRTCILSTRFKDLWKRLPTLLLHSADFGSVKRFSKFVLMLLSLRDDSVALADLDLERCLCIEPTLLRKVINYAISRNVQRLGLDVQCDVHHIPQPCLFSSQTLTCLKLSVSVETRGGSGRRFFVFPNSLYLPALTTLHLVYYIFCANVNGIVEPFSGFAKLNRLIIEHCDLSDSQILCISSTTLANLTVISDYRKDWYTIQLNSLSLRTFVFRGLPCQKLCGINISSLQHVNIDARLDSSEQAKFDAVICSLGQANFDAVICSLGKSNFDVDVCWSKPSLILLSWPVEFANIKSLTISASTLQVLFLIPHLLKLKVSILGSLKSLKVIHKPLRYGFFWIVTEVELLKVPFKSQKAAAAMLQKAKKREVQLHLYLMEWWSFCFKTRRRQRLTS